MRSEVEEVVERLRQARSLAWLRVIDDAELDKPATSKERPEFVVEPYRWLVERVGSGVRLTQAGYLPPAMVTGTGSAAVTTRSAISRSVPPSRPSRSTNVTRNPPHSRRRRVIDSNSPRPLAVLQPWVRTSP